MLNQHCRVLSPSFHQILIMCIFPFMNKTLPDICKDTRDGNVARGHAGICRNYLRIHLCKYLNAKQKKSRKFRK